MPVDHPPPSTCSIAFAKYGLRCVITTLNRVACLTTAVMSPAALLQMKPDVREVRQMLDHSDSPYIRAVSVVPPRDAHPVPHALCLDDTSCLLQAMLV